MVAAPAFVSRLTRLALLDADGEDIGRIDDVVLVPARTEAPRVLGFVVAVGRRRIFVNAGRVGDIDPTGARLRSGTLDVRPFHRRAGEQLATADLIGSRVGDEFVTDLSIEPSSARGSWHVASVALGRRGPLRRRAPRIVPWDQAPGLFPADAEQAEMAELREMHQAEVAERIRRLPLHRRRRLAEMMEDERLADLLEELPEDEQIRIIEGLDLERAAHVLEEMEPDDAVDLLHELPGDAANRLLDAMEPTESRPLRRLLNYADDTAGGLMTPEPVILPLTATVAEAQAVVRNPELPMELAAQVFVVRPPTSTPTGAFLGSVPFQRLLREAPATALEHCVINEPQAVAPGLPLPEVAERLASYDALAVAVCDDAGRLVGAVTVDDVLDHVLPTGWRRKVPR